jgi:hypothetical protein
MQESWEKLREGQALQSQQWRGREGKNELTKEEEGEWYLYTLPGDGISASLIGSCTQKSLAEIRP